jgi:CRP-like cAMP-binding protein
VRGEVEAFCKTGQSPRDEPEKETTMTLSSLSSGLSGHEVFSSLSREEVSRVSEFSSEKRFEPTEIIYRKDTPATHFFLVLEGTVLLQLPGTTPRGIFSVVRVKQGEAIGLAPVLGYERYTVRAIAESQATLLAVEVKPFLAILQANAIARSSVIATVARSYYTRYMGLVGILQGIAGQLTLRP